MRGGMSSYLQRLQAMRESPPKPKPVAIGVMRRLVHVVVGKDKRGRDITRPEEQSAATSKGVAGAGAGAGVFASSDHERTYKHLLGGQFVRTDSGCTRGMNKKMRKALRRANKLAAMPASTT